MAEKQNLHVHTYYCDGKNSPEEILDEAIRQGFTSIGFSGHSYYSPNQSMNRETAKKYRAHIRRVKEEYADRIRVHLGLEQEYYSPDDMEGYEYLIGSVHYLKCGPAMAAFDRDAQAVRKLIDRFFDGDGLAFAKRYYETLAALPEIGKFDILGHPDVHCKHIETLAFLDEADPRYRKYALEAIDALRGKIPLFEVNTGAISRGYRKTPYPAPFLLDALRDMGFGAIISSDCHNAKDLSCGYGIAAELLLAHGFKEIWILGENGFTSQKLEGAR